MSPLQKTSRNNKMLLNWIAFSLISEYQQEILPEIIDVVAVHRIDFMTHRTEFYDEYEIDDISEFNTNKDFILNLIVCYFIYILIINYLYIIYILFIHYLYFTGI